MTKHHLLLSAAVMALMIGGISPASAQYYREYKPNDKPPVEVDMGVLDGSAEPQRNTYMPPVESQPVPAPQPVVSMPPAAAAPAPAPIRVLKPSGPPPMEEAEVAEQEEIPAPQPVRPAPVVAKPYRPYLTTPVAKQAPAPQAAQEEAVPAPQPIRSYPPAPTPKTVERETPAAPRPVRSYPETAPKLAEETPPEPVKPPAPLPQVVEQEPPAPLPQPVPKPVVAKKYEPSPSVVDDSSYKPDYSGYYKSGAPVPAAIANLAPKHPQPKPVAEEIATAPASQKDVAEQLTEELTPPPQLDPLPEIVTEKSIEQTPPPVARMEPIISQPAQPTRMAAQPVQQTKISSMPPPKVEYQPQQQAAPAYQPARTPAKIISYPDSTVVTRPSGQSVAAPAPVMTPEPADIPAVPPAQKVVSMPAPQRKPEPVPVPEAAPAPVVAAAPATPNRPSLEILNTPAPERPATEKTESIIPPVRQEAQADISKLAEQVDNATAEMAAAPALVDPPKFAAVPTHSDLTLEFPGNSSDLTSATQRKLDAIVRQMEDLVDGGRLQVRGYAAGEDGSKSSARRIALSRALSVRSYLMDKGVKAKRVDVRAMGSETDRNPLDRVDLIFQR